ncbi:hypothetical protein OSTOST_07933 [Ostertagia ostertagi]
MQKRTCVLCGVLASQASMKQSSINKKWNIVLAASLSLAGFLDTADVGNLVERITSRSKYLCPSHVVVAEGLEEGVPAANAGQQDDSAEPGRRGVAEEEVEVEDVEMVEEVDTSEDEAPSETEEGSVYEPESSESEFSCDGDGEQLSYSILVNVSVLVVMITTKRANLMMGPLLNNVAVNCNTFPHFISNDSDVELTFHPSGIQHTFFCLLLSMRILRQQTGVAGHYISIPPSVDISSPPSIPSCVFHVAASKKCCRLFLTSLPNKHTFFCLLLSMRILRQQTGVAGHYISIPPTVDISSPPSIQKT